MNARLTFTVSPGRCGTAYLAQLLKTIPGIWVGHEAQPDFVNCAYAAQSLPAVADRFWREVKLPAIEHLAWPVYVETSHLFAHGFFEALTLIAPRFGLIFLRRPHRDVALSLWRRGSIPARTERGFLYLLNPGGVQIHLRPECWWELSDYQLCYWHCLEIEARQWIYREELAKRGWRTVDVTLDELNDRDGLRHIVGALELPIPNWNSVDELLGQRVNENPMEYQGRLPVGDLDRLEAEMRERCG